MARHQQALSVPSEELGEKIPMAGQDRTSTGGTRWWHVHQIRDTLIHQEKQ